MLICLGLLIFGQIAYVLCRLFSDYSDSYAAKKEFFIELTLAVTGTLLLYFIIKRVNNISEY